MSDGSGNVPNINLAKEAARAWVNGLPSGKSECAITSFDDKNYLIQDFTTDRNKLLTGIDKLHPQGGTNYDAALLNPKAGGLLITNNGKYKRVIIFLSDGMPNYEPQTSKIIQEAKAQNVTIFGVTLGMPCPQNIKDFTTQTGGMWYENVTTLEQARQTYQQMLQTAQGGDPCTIEWESGTSCNPGQKYVEIKLLPQNLTATTSYQIPNTAVAKLEFNPVTVKFQNPTPGVKVEEKVTVTARNANFTVTNITSNNGGFEITPKSFALNSGQSIELTVSYIPADSGYNYCKFEIENNVCPTKYYASGGWKGKKPTIRTIKLIHPNGGELFVAGSDTVITWEGVPPDEVVKLEYRTDDNQPWITISDTAKGLSHRFKVPKIASKKYLARVTSKAQTHYSECDNPDVEICGKIWMGCNLDVEHYRNGDPIRHAKTDSEWIDAGNKREGAWCYYENNDSFGKIYGKLYNWYAVNDPRGLAPEGWHVATDAEWEALETCLGGSLIAGGKLKSTGTIEGGDGLWAAPNKGATNETGFSAFPGGRRNDNGAYFDIDYFGYWWSATELTTSIAWYRAMGYLDAIVNSGYSIKLDGFSVRCVRD